MWIGNVLAKSSLIFRLIVFLVSAVWFLLIIYMHVYQTELYRNINVIRQYEDKAVQYLFFAVTQVMSTLKE